MEFLTIALEHWPFFAASGLLWAIGQVIKAIVPPAATNKHWSIVWRLLPFYPFLFGLVIGCLPWAPLPPVVKTLGGFVGFLYYGASGVLASWFHDIWSTFKKYKLSVSEDGTE